MPNELSMVFLIISSEDSLNSPYSQACKDDWFVHLLV